MGFLGRISEPPSHHTPLVENRPRQGTDTHDGAVVQLALEPLFDVAILDFQMPDGAPLGWERVQAICDFVHQHVSFGYEHARATKTAWQAFSEGTGVCRDLTHLAIALCRCMNIPARYCTGYLSDIGEPPLYAPMDFAAWFEAYLGGQWHTFDPRNNAPCARW